MFGNGEFCTGNHDNTCVSELTEVSFFDVTSGVENFEGPWLESGNASKICKSNWESSSQGAIITFTISRIFEHLKL